MAYAHGLEQAESISAKRFGHGLAQATAEQRLQAARALEQENRTFFELVRKHTLEGYYGSPRHGGNRDAVSWRMLGLAEPPVRGRHGTCSVRNSLVKRVNAVVVGAGAAGGIVARELATAGLSVVLLERGKWYTANDCRKDDLRNQRTTVLGNAFGPEDEGNPRVWVDSPARRMWCCPAKGRTRTTRPAWAAER